MIVVGPGRGEAFKVCTDKKGCSIHWGAEQRAAKKRASEAVKDGGTTGEDRPELQRRKREEERKREEAARERWK